MISNVVKNAVSMENACRAAASVKMNSLEMGYPALVESVELSFLLCMSLISILLFYSLRFLDSKFGTQFTKNAILIIV